MAFIYRWIGTRFVDGTRLAKRFYRSEMTVVPIRSTDLTPVHPVARREERERNGRVCGISTSGSE